MLPLTSDVGLPVYGGFLIGAHQLLTDEPFSHTLPRAHALGIITPSLVWSPRSAASSAAEGL